LAVFAIV